MAPSIPPKASILLRERGKNHKVDAVFTTTCTYCRTVYVYVYVSEKLSERHVERERERDADNLQKEKRGIWSTCRGLLCQISAPQDLTFVWKKQIGKNNGKVHSTKQSE